MPTDSSPNKVKYKSHRNPKKLRKRWEARTASTNQCSSVASNQAQAGTNTSQSKHNPNLKQFIFENEASLLPNDILISLNNSHQNYITQITSGISSLGISDVSPTLQQSLVDQHGRLRTSQLSYSTVVRDVKWDDDKLRDLDLGPVPVVQEKISPMTNDEGAYLPSDPDLTGIGSQFSR